MKEPPEIGYGYQERNYRRPTPKRIDYQFLFNYPATIVKAYENSIIY